MSSTGVEVFQGGGGVAIGSHARITSMGLQLTGDVPEQELERIGDGLNILNEAHCWAVGDWANFYREHFPERFREVVTRLDEKTVRVYAAVAKAYPVATRARFCDGRDGRRVVSFAHFSLVRRYGAQRAEYWLERAASEDLSLQQLELLVEDQAPPGGDVAPPLPRVPTAALGTFYSLGAHRVICGDATDPTTIARLMGDEHAAMIWTDPPYGVEYVGKTQEALTIQNDDAAGLRALLVGAWRACAPVLVDGAPFYVAGPTGPNAQDFIASFVEVGWDYDQLLIWVKNVMTLTRQDYHSQNEGVYYGNAPWSGARPGRMTKERYRWYGDDSQVAVFNVKRPASSQEHPTMKPVDLIRPMLLNSSLPGEVVLDPFAGSGSTMIAAEQAGRRAYMVELEPAYVDVIVDRWFAYQEEQRRAGALPIVEGQAGRVDYGPGPLDA